MRECNKEFLQCPYCNYTYSAKSTAETVSEFESGQECGHIVECRNCNKEFEVCIQYSFAVNTHAIETER